MRERCTATWATTTPFTPVSVEDHGGFGFLGGTTGAHYDGDLRGDSTYNIKLVLDPVNRAYNALVEETFTGTVAGVGTGHLQLIQADNGDPTTPGNPQHEHATAVLVVAVATKPTFTG